MHKGRLEAFSDGVLAIIITIMVLEMKPPLRGAALADLKPVLPAFLSYILSFVYLGIYWNNHHHMFQVTHRVSGGILWANLHLLFWLSLIPFVTAWMGENHFASVPVALYGIDMLMAAIAYYILAHALVRHHGRESRLAVALFGSNGENKAVNGTSGGETKERPMVRLRKRVLLWVPVLLPLIILVGTGLRGLDFGLHWDERPWQIGPVKHICCKRSTRRVTCSVCDAFTCSLPH